MDERSLRPAHIDKVDSRSIYKVYEAWPANAVEANRLAPEVKEKKYERVVYLAVGGSAAAGDIISDWLLSRGGVELSVFHGFMPSANLERALVIACSTSGDTAETIALTKAALSRCSDIVTISSGGKLRRLAEREGLAHVTIPLSLAPRYTLPYSLFASIAVLRRASLLGELEDEVEETLRNLARKGREIASGVPLGRNPSKRIASLVARSKPRIYSSSVAKGVAHRFKTGLNENAKHHAFFDSAPELFHNEVEAWETPDETFQPLFVRHSMEPPFERRSLDRFNSILERSGSKPRQLRGSGKGSLSQLLTLCYTLDFSTYYAGILRGVDPYEIKLISELKGS